MSISIQYPIIMVNGEVLNKPLGRIPSHETIYKLLCDMTHLVLGIEDRLELLEDRIAELEGL